MRVRHSRLFAIASIVAGILLGVLALLADRVSFVGALTPVAFLVVGAALLSRPYVVIHEGAVIVKALFGPGQEIYPLDPEDAIEFEGKRVYVTRDRVRRRLRGVSGWLAHKQDWAAFQAWGARRAR